MCRSIKTLRGLEPAVSDDEVHAAALRFVRKISGYRSPSRINQPIFDAAVDEIVGASQRLLGSLVVSGGSQPSDALRAPGERPVTHTLSRPVHVHDAPASVLEAAQ